MDRRIERTDDIENLLKDAMTIPVSSKAKRVAISNGKNERIISEVVKEIIINREGVPQTTETQQSIILDDGESLSGITQCQTCQSFVHAQSIHRCPCGRTTCLRRGCGKVWGKTWFCSVKCVVLHKLHLLRRF